MFESATDRSSSQDVRPLGGFLITNHLTDYDGQLFPEVTAGQAATLDRELPQTQEVARRAVAGLLVDGLAVAVGSGPDSWQLIHATDQVAALLTELQCMLGEGPGVDSSRTGKPTLIPDLAAAAGYEKWPGFAQEAARTGARGMFALPLVIVDVPFGMVQGYCRRPGALVGRTLIDAVVLAADLGRAMLTDLGAVSSTGGQPLAIFRDTAVAQATGMVSVQLKSSIPDALAQLRARAFAEGRPIVELAHDILARRYAFGSGD